MKNDSDGRLQAAAASLAHLPGRPALYLRAARMIGEGKATIADISRAIRGDAAATAALLRLANSPLYYRSRHIGTVSEALGIIGLDGAKALIITVYFASLQREAQGADWWMRERHGVATAIAARSLAERMRPGDSAFPERCYVAGLLHDVGRVGFAGVPRPPGSLENGARGEPTLADERAGFGYDHARLGSAVAHAWNLPPDVCDAIRDHHEPVNEAADPLLSAIVHLSDLAAEYVMQGEARDPEPGALALAGFSFDDYRVWQERVGGLLAEAEEWARASELDRTEAEVETAGVLAVKPPEVHVVARHPDPAAKMPAGM